jgi:hypothetical protein
MSEEGVGSMINSSSLIKTCALVAAGAFIGYALSNFFFQTDLYYEIISFADFLII